MYNVTLVCTHHSDLGKCNSDELYKIIESIRPDVIFEELTPDLFDRFYNKNNIPFETPEVKSVRRYIKNHSISHFPVDINVTGTSTTTDIYFVFNTIRNNSA